MSKRFVFVLVAVLCVAMVMGAPKPINWKQLGRNALNIGKQALPVGCRLINGNQPYYPPVYQYPNQYLYPNAGAQQYYY